MPPTDDATSNNRRSLPIVSLTEWWNDTTTSTAGHRLPLLDVRCASDYKQQHLRAPTDDSNATIIVHIPLQDLKARSYELPPRPAPFCLLLPDNNANADATNTADDVDVDVDALYDFLLGGNGQQQRKQKPWTIPYAIRSSDQETWNQAATLNLLHKQDWVSSPAAIVSSPFRSLPRLWQPEPMVQHVLWPILLQSVVKDGTNSNTLQQTRTQVWDLGAGSGRDVCFLAGKLKEETTSTRSISRCSSVTVVGLDQRYKENEQAEECGKFWKRSAVGDVTRSQRIQLQDWETFEKALILESSRGSSIRCLFAVRFWNRPLVHGIVNTPLLNAGTIFAISQFGKAAPEATWDFAHPKVRALSFVVWCVGVS